MLKTVIKNSLKLILAIGLILWLVKSGKLDFTLFYKLLQSPWIIVAAIFMMQLDHMIIVLRLRIILIKNASNGLSFFRLFLANWIGIYFNSVLPGSVTGDIIKIFYIQDLDKNLTKKFLLVSVFIDRIIGLLGLIIAGSIASILYYNTLLSLSHKIAPLVHFNFMMLAGVILILILLFFLPNLPYLFAAPFKKISFLKKIFEKLEDIWRDLCLFKKKFLILLGLSTFIQGFAIFIFWFLVHPYADGNLDLASTMAIAPIGFISLAIPIAPSGLGVGHVVFEKLFSFIGVMNGASLFNLYFFVILFSNLTGVIPYILYSKKGKSVEALDEIEKEIS
jgi:uncharacterized membrane protein YbhN (UPF0104 family)